MALAPWGPVTVKKEEEEEGNFLGQASSQQVHSENVKVWAPREGLQAGLDGAEQETKVNNGLGGMRGERPEDLKQFRRGPCPSASTPESCCFAKALAFSPLEYDSSILF